MSQELEVLFNSKGRPKVLKLFFQNQATLFSVKDVAKKSQITPATAKKELEQLRRIKLLERKKQKRNIFYELNNAFPFLNELKTMVLSAPPISASEIKRMFEKLPRVKLFVMAGKLLREKKSPVDFLIVGDNIPKSKAAQIVRKIESNVGREMEWSLMPTEEYKYRYQINDRFIRDIFGYRHKMLIDRLKEN
jgi:DNA-binding transcriptional regulator YhcF (GntR family)